ncbi:helix-turn-helix domain-containing protein [uncultured Acetobacteroides sp.]|uniref:helix-turn-helix domain-containing protein n=1 Tax=uncultured Acetobacteroides sp. TaxID=1760811 RepID=UPI0029F45855|nr:helix-turn-helix domain-containing protein [uncultured Acetobacteroides sp.]
MLVFNLSRIFRAAGVRDPRKFLKEKGYKENTVHRIVNLQVSQLRLSSLEAMCLKLGCTPNDLLEWRPSRDFASKDVPLQQLRLKQEEDLQIDDMVMQLSYEQQLKLKEMIKEQFGEKAEVAQ